MGKKRGHVLAVPYPTQGHITPSVNSANVFNPKRVWFSCGSFLYAVLSCNYVYYLSYKNNGSLDLPIEELPFLELQDVPSFISVSGSYPAFFDMLLQQFTNFEKADFVLVNTFQELDLHEKELLSNVCPVLTIGPTIPSMYLDQRIKSDTDYDMNLFDSEDGALCSKWLNTRPQGSSEEEKLPSGFLETVNKDKSLVLKWSPQLEVLANKAIGCFMTHCGWNSTMEALTFGVPMVAMPQWTDQPMNAKYIQDVWKVGVRVKVEKESGIAKREEIEFSIKGSDGRK
ncbi:unnamed protein product [Microthlaspi erraticum]|uniref:Uncharacterized protein n=1 Tax=Microthlaspi erraticum TaxID=1685480 RepID=A0A6D2K8I6_9BRAS|nr:unnamed protein product [Microthlaspi erraticum]